MRRWLKTLPCKIVLLIFVAVMVFIAGREMWHKRGVRDASVQMHAFQDKPRYIQGWKERQEELRREWTVEIAPSPGDVTDVFMVNVGGGIPGLKPRQTVLMWRAGGQAYVARTPEPVQSGENKTVLDLSDGMPLDAATLDALLSLKPSLDNLTGMGILATDMPSYAIYVKRGAEQSTYLVLGEMLLVKPALLPGFSANTEAFWINHQSVR